MEQKIKELIEELKNAGKEKYSVKGVNDPDAKVNVWYVVAKLEEALLEGRK